MYKEPISRVIRVLMIYAVTLFVSFTFWNLDINRVSAEVVASQPNAEVTPPAAETVISGDLTLTQDMTYQDLRVEKGVVNLAGYTLTVQGDLIQSGGVIYIAGGELAVDGDYRIQSKKVASDGTVTYESSNGYFVMDAGKVKVDGQFVMQNARFNNSGDVTAGIMEVNGDVNIISGGFDPGGTHKVILNGTKLQTIEMDQAYISRLEITNKSEQGVKFTSKVYITKELFPTTTPILDGHNVILSVNVPMPSSWTSGIGFLGDYSLPQDLTVAGDMYVHYGTINLNGKKLMIKGNLIQYGGEVFINEGQLNIDGDYRITNERIPPSNNCYMYASFGSFRMTKDSDYVRVGGSFVTQNGMNHEGYLTAGTLEVSGDFIEDECGFTYSYPRFYGSGTHKVILSGTSLQTISLESNLSRFNILEINNKSEDGVKFTNKLNAVTFLDNGNKVTFDLGVPGWTLTKDEIYSGDLYIGEGVLDLAGHKLMIEGNLIQSGGTVNVNGGELIVTDDYRIQSKRVASNGTVTYYRSEGYLKMVNTSDLIKVGGQFAMESINSHADLLTAGILEVGGDFSQKSVFTTDNFLTKGTHKVILNGDQLQTIRMAYGMKSYFNILEITNTSVDGVMFASEVYINKELSPTETPITDGQNLVLGSNVPLPSTNWQSGISLYGDRTLQQDITINGDLIIREGSSTINLNGKKLTVKGKLNQKDGTTIFINNGQLNVDRDYTLGNSLLQMTKDSDYVRVGGNFTTYTKYSHKGYLTAGVLEVAGNFFQIYKTPYGFYASDTHKVILNGTSLQTIRFDAFDSRFNVLEINNKSEAGVQFDPGVQSQSTIQAIKFIDNGNRVSMINGGDLGWTLTKDEVYNGNLNLAGGVLDLNGHKLTINGNLIQSGGTIDVNGGELIVGTNYLNQYYIGVYGTLKMDNVDSRVMAVNFITESQVNHENLLSAGTMKIKGNFIQRSFKDNFRTQGTHKVILNGDGVQNVQFSHPDDSRFNILVITKRLETGYTFNRTPVWVTLIEELSDTEPPTAPTDFKLRKTNNLLSFSFMASQDNVGVQGYEIYRNGKLLIKTIGYSNYFYADTPSTPGVFKYTVLAYDLAGNKSEMSNEISIDYEAPSVPTGLSIQNTSDNSITLQWTASTDGEGVGVTGYEIYRDGKKVGTAKETTYTDKSLVANKTYTYTIKAYDGSGNVSEASEPVEGSTITDTEPPSIPSKVRIHSRTGSTLTIKWDASTDNQKVVGYEFLRDGVLIGQTTEPQYTDTKLKTGTAYSYTILAFDARGNKSALSTAVEGTPILPHLKSVEPASGKTMGGTKPQRIKIYFVNSQNAEGSKATAHYSFKGSEEIAIETKMQGPFSENSTTSYFYYDWDLTNLPSGSYTVIHSFIDAAGYESNQSSIYEIDRTAPSVVQQVKAATLAGSIRLNWQESMESDVNKYNVYRSTSVDGPFTFIGDVKGRTQTQFIDRNVQSNQEYFYVVTALDLFDQESEQSLVVGQTAIEDNVPPVILGIEPLDGTKLGTKAEITVRAEDNHSLQSISLEYSTDNGATWNIVGQIEGKQTAVFKWDTSQLHGEVWVRAIAVDQAGNTSDSTVVRIYTVDSSGPEKVTGVQATTYPNQVFVRWNDVADQDYAYFQVEIKSKADGEYRIVEKVYDKLGTTIYNLQVNTRYWIRIVAYDKFGNRGTESDEVEVTTTPDTIAPVIKALNPMPGSFAAQIPLEAVVTDNKGVVSVTFQKSNNSIIWEDIATIEVPQAPETAYAKYQYDVSGMNEGIIVVRAIAKDAAGNTSKASKYVEYKVDRTAPQAPTGLQVNYSAGYVTLQWDQGVDKDIQYYKIYRTIDKKGSYELVKNHHSYISYHDYSVNPGDAFYYQVAAVDEAGNESLKSESLLATVSADDEVPVIHSMVPSDQKTVGANPNIQVSVSDNHKVTTVSMFYRNTSDPNAEWISIGDHNLNARSGVAALTWDTTELSTGAYQIKVNAEDAAGNKSAERIVQVQLKNQPPTKPQVEVKARGWGVDLTWTGDDSEQLAGYYIYRSSAYGGDYKLLQSTPENRISDEGLQPGQPYYYVVEAIDPYGNKARSKEIMVIPTSEDSYNPAAHIGEDQLAVVGMEVAFDGTSSTDNDRIARYEWNFGDGTKSSASQPKHIFSSVGTYTVRLTVYDPAGNQASAEKKVIVKEKQQTGRLKVRVIDQDTGLSVPGAHVFINVTEGTQHYYTDGSGYVTIIAAPGNYEIASYREQYLPNSMSNVSIVASEEETITLTVKKGKLVEGSLEVNRITLEEAIDAGINVNDASNQYIYKFDLNLTFVVQKIPSLYVNGEGKILNDYKPIKINYNGGGDRNWPMYLSPHVIPSPSGQPGIPPTLVYLVVPGSVSWGTAQELPVFEVGLVISNMAEPQFVLEDSSVELGLPGGLSLLSSNYESSRIVDLGNIQGQETKEVKWIIRGDRSGSYDISALFKGTLMPFEELIQTVFKTASPVEVVVDDAVSYSGLNLNIRVEDWAFPGEPYFIEYYLTNTSEAPIPNVSLNGEEKAKLMPGETLYSIKTEYVTTSEPLEPDEAFKLISSNVVTAEGSNASVPTTVTVAPSASLFNHQLELYLSQIADPIDASTGAMLVNRNLLSTGGENPIQLGLSYQSEMLKPGDVGAGWSHPYEIRLERKADNYIRVHWNANHYNHYTLAKDAVGFVGANKAVRDDRITETEDGGYVLVRGDQSVYYFNAEGQLVRKGDRFGRTQSMNYNNTNRLVKITDDSTKQYLSFKYDDKGNLVHLSDQAQREVSLTYNDSRHLTAITDVNGNETIYTYDEQGRMFTGTDAEEITLFTNTYDAEGRVIVQDDAVEGNKLTQLTFSEESYTTTSFTNRNGDIEYRLHDRKGQLLKSIDALGNITSFTYNINGEIEKIAYADGTSVTMTYDERGNQTSIKDVAGQITRMTYDERNNLLTITDPKKGTTTYSYNGNNRVTSETDSRGFTTTFTYDDQGNLAAKTAPDEGITRYTYKDGMLHTMTDPEGFTTTNEYDAAGRLVGITDSLGNKTSMQYDNGFNIIAITGTTGDTTSFTYNSHGDQLTKTDPNGHVTSYQYDGNGNKVRMTDALGGETVYATDGEGRLTRETDPLGNVIESILNANGSIAESIDPNGGAIRYKYDPMNRVTEVIDPLGNSVRNEYDARGLIESIQDSLGYKTAFTYDPTGNLTSTLNVLKHTTRQAVDLKGNVIEKTNELDYTTRYTYDWRGNILTETDALGKTTTYSYDKKGQLVRVMNAAGEVTSYQYDGNGNLLQMIDPSGQITAYVYDAKSNLIQKTDADGSIMKWTYDMAGNLTSETNAEGHVVTYTHDALGRIVSEMDEAGNITTMEYDASGQLQKVTDPLDRSLSYTYDGNGNVRTFTDAKGFTTTYNYDANNQLVSTINPLQEETRHVYDSNGQLIESIDALGQSTKYKYDALGRLTGTENALGYTMTTDYDAAGNVVNRIDSLGNSIETINYNGVNQPINSTNALGHTTTYSYDDLHRLSHVTDPMERVEQLSYNHLDQITQVTDAMGGQSKQTFDALGRVIEIVDPNGNVSSFTYDKLGRLTEEANAVGGTLSYQYNSRDLLEQYTNARNQAATYEYDKADRLVRMTDPDGTIAYVYDDNDNVISVTENDGNPIKREYDALNRVTKYTDAHGNTIQYEYDAAGNVSNKTYSNGNAVSYNYDVANQLTQVTDWNGLITKYSYDANGRLLQTQRPNGTVETRQYDTAGQLIQLLDKTAQGDIINEYNYSYDIVGNVTEETQLVSDEAMLPTGTVKMTYMADNRLDTYNGEKVQYDADGNMIYGPLKGTMQTFVYDSRNRLIQAGSMTYTYDAENNRIATNNNGVITKYAIDPHAYYSQVWMESDAQNIPQSYYVYGLGLTHREDAASGAIQTYHFDRRGSTTALTDSKGQITDRYTYGPYGEMWSHQGETIQPFQYNGQYGVMTDSNGLYYMRARYYNPEIKRFINRDVLRGNILEGQSLNRHAYVNGNPISYIDPFGLSRDSDVPWYLQAFNDVLDFVPGVSSVKSFIEATTGYNVITGEELSALERALAAAGIIPGGKIVSKGADLGINQTKKIFGRGSKKSDDVAEKMKKAECNCFTAGTKVLTDEGEKNIEDIEVGDMVLAKDQNDPDGELAYKEVTALYTNYRNDIIKLYIGDLLIETTDNHPFWVEGKGWVFADELKVGDKLQKADGSNLTIDKVEFVLLDELVMVYNFTVADYHTYYVTDLGIWVHNTNCNIEGAGNRPPNLTPEGAGRNGAFREAKRNSDIPVSQQPKGVTPAVDKRGNRIPGKDYDFGNGKVIRDHSGGHEYPDDPSQNRGSHFNDVDGNHYDYDK